MAGSMTRPRLVGELIDPCLGDALKRQGFARSTLILSWPEIAGERLAERCAPARIDWPKRPAGDGPSDPATLVVRVESAFALELQHMAPVLIDRINAHLGWRCIGRLVLKQGPLPRRPVPRARPAPPSPAVAAAAARSVEAVSDERLQASLKALGEAVLTRAEASRTKS